MSNTDTTARQTIMTAGIGHGGTRTIARTTSGMLNLPQYEGQPDYARSTAHDDDVDLIVCPEMSNGYEMTLSLGVGESVDMAAGDDEYGVRYWVTGRDGHRITSGSTSGYIKVTVR